MSDKELYALKLKNSLIYAVPSKTVREVLEDADSFDPDSGVGSIKNLRAELYREHGIKGVLAEILKLLALCTLIIVLSFLLKDKWFTWLTLLSTFTAWFTSVSAFTALAVISLYLVLTKDWLLVGNLAPERKDILPFACLEALAAVLGLFMVILPLIDLMTWRIVEVLASISCLGALAVLFLYILGHKVWLSGIMLHFITNVICGIIFFRQLASMSYEYYFGSMWPAELIMTSFSVVWFTLMLKKRGHKDGSVA